MFIYLLYLVVLLSPQVESPWLYKTLEEYPKQIQTLKINIAKHSVECGDFITAPVGTTEWFRLWRADVTCKRLAVEELELERAESELKLRMCDKLSAK